MTSLVQQNKFFKCLRVCFSQKKNKEAPTFTTCGMTATAGFDLEYVLERLPNASFLTLREEFGNGVSLVDFTKILHHESTKSDAQLADPSKRVEFEERLRQLFTIIDVNNNGKVSWDEFSHYVMYAVQAPVVSESKEIVQHIAFEYVGRCPIEATRLRSAHMDFSRQWDKYILLECGATTSRLTLYRHNPPGSELPLRTYAEYRSTNLLESITYVDSVRAVAGTTTNGKLQFFSVTEDPVLEDSGQMQRLTKFREHHLEGRHPVLKYDPETRCLFAGSREGIITIINPEDDSRVTPAILQQVRLHTQTVLDLCILPERGNKKLLSSSLDGKIQMYDIVRTEFYGELGTDIAAQSMSFCDEFSVLVTCSNKDLDPLMWAPHAVSNVYIGRLESGRPGHRSRLVSALCPKGTPYCFTADVQGQIKLWDLRKLKQVVSFYGDGDLVKNDMSPQITFRSFASDPKNLDVVSFCRSEFGNGLEVCRSKLVSTRDPLLAHDDIVVGFCCTVAAVGFFFTASEDCVKIWKTESGEVAHHFKHLFPEEQQERISAIAVDPEGHRFYLGTLKGTVAAISTATCGLLGEASRHRCAVIRLILAGEILFSLSSDAVLYATDISGDSPQLLYCCRQDDEEIRSLTMDVARSLSLVAVGLTNGCLALHDCAEHAHGAPIARIRPMEDTRNSAKDDDISRYMLPKAPEITAVKLCAPRAFVCYGDTRGSLNIAACRPHPCANRRMCWWKTFFPKSTTTFFAVALSIEWRDSSATLIVGDDQGNVTLWDCAEVLERYCFVPSSFPAPMQQLLSLPKPKEAPLVYAPKLRGYFTISSSLTPLRSLRLLTSNQFVVIAEKTVLFCNMQGDICGSLMQGRGTILSSRCNAFHFAFEDIDAPPEAVIESSTEVVNEVLSEKVNFVSISERDYCNLFSQNHIDSNATVASSKLTVQDEIEFNAESPENSPLEHFKTQCRVSSSLPKSVRSIHFIGQREHNEQSPYYKPLQLRDSAYSPPLVRMFEDDDDHDAEGNPSKKDDKTDVIRNVITKLENETMHCKSDGMVCISTRSQPISLRNPTMAAVYSSDTSFTSDWKSKLLQKPHHVGWIHDSVTKFVSFESMAPSQSILTAPLDDASARVPQARKSFHAFRGRGPFQTEATERPNSRFGKKAKLPEAEVTLQSDDSWSTFKMIDEPKLDFERELILKKVQQRIETEFDKRSLIHAAQMSKISQPMTIANVVKSVARAERMEEGIPIPRASTPSFGFGKSPTLERILQPHTWKASKSPMLNRKYELSPDLGVVGKREPRQGSANVTRTQSATPSAGRRDYVNVLLHLPRLKDVFKVDEQKR